MAKVKVELIHGVKLGDSVYHDVTLRELTPGDIIEASVESERGLPTGQNSYAFAVSPTLMGINTLLRQIDAIGEFNGPVTMTMLSKFHREDFEILQREAEKVDMAVMEAIESRGRDDASVSDAGDANPSIQPVD